MIDPAIAAGVVLLPPPLLTADQALFLDVDGTLLELAPTPSQVAVPAGLVELLQNLEDQLQAVALVTGRSLHGVNDLLAPWQPSGAGVHGTELRLPGSRTIRGAAPIDPAIVRALRDRFAQVPEILIEDKGTAVAVHFARCPQYADTCEEAMIEIVRATAGLRLLRGRAVVEILPLESDKGSAVRELMRHAPFAGRRPVFVGDDVTDEAAFAAVETCGGVSVKVGPGLTLASYRLAGQPQVLQWLHASLASLRGPGTTT